MESRPKVGSTYRLTLSSSLRLKTNLPFWVLFQNPLSNLNGIDTEKDITDLVFCKCEFIKLYRHDTHSADIQIKILEIKGLHSLVEFYKPEIAWWTLFEDYNTFKKNGRTENFKNYSFISINVQSDLGIDLIILKEFGESRIIAVHDWDFHLSEWNLCNIPFTKEDEEKYGIEFLSDDA